MMTRLEQAIRWWLNPRNGDENIPPRHVRALIVAGMVRRRGPDELLHETRLMPSSPEGETP